MLVQSRAGVVTKQAKNCWASRMSDKWQPLIDNDITHRSGAAISL